jgi:hypothetical protein
VIVTPRNARVRVAIQAFDKAGNASAWRFVTGAHRHGGRRRLAGAERPAWGILPRRAARRRLGGPVAQR